MLILRRFSWTSIQTLPNLRPHDQNNLHWHASDDMKEPMRSQSIMGNSGMLEIHCNNILISDGEQPVRAHKCKWALCASELCIHLFSWNSAYWAVISVCGLGSWVTAELMTWPDILGCCLVSLHFPCDILIHLRNLPPFSAPSVNNKRTTEIDIPRVKKKRQKQE